MDEVFIITLQQFGTLLLFIGIGYLLKYFGVLNETKTLSALLMWVFMPATVFNVFYKNFTPQNFLSALPYEIAGTAVLLITLVASYPLVKRYKDRIVRNTYWYSMVNTNNVYIGLPLVSAIFPKLVLYFMMFILPYQIFIYTVGVNMFKPEKEKISLKTLLTPTIIAVVLGMICGMVVGALNVQMPNVISGILDSSAACMSPIAMIVMGCTLARTPLKKIFSNWGPYLFTALRLVVIPAVIGGLTYLMYLWLVFSIDIVKITIIYLALPMGLNTVVFAEANGEDGTIGAQCVFISHVACLGTLPLVFALVSAL